MEQEDYSTEIKCINCKRANYFYKIPIGTTIEEFIKEKKIICKNCGCSIIKIKEEEEE